MTETTWKKRDELAAMFMQAIVGGLVAMDVDPRLGADDYAIKAYRLADAFLAVRRERAEGGVDNG